MTAVAMLSATIATVLHFDRTFLYSVEKEPGSLSLDYFRQLQTAVNVQLVKLVVRTCLGKKPALPSQYFS